MSVVAELNPITESVSASGPASSYSRGIPVVAMPATKPPPPALSQVNPDMIITKKNAPDFEALATRFRPIFARIAAGAIDREQNRRLAFEAVAELRAAGFHTLRIPIPYGGLGATLPQFFRLLVELAEADSNISHLFRGHFAFLEARLSMPDKALQEVWFRRVVAGTITGYAMAERTEATGGTAQLIKEGDRWLVDGIKYYSTGTIYADWIVASVKEGDERVSIAVPVDAPGVHRIDDWDGFGQRLTGSGTTRFDRVVLAPENIIRRFSTGESLGLTYGKSCLQLILLSSITGAGKAALREGVGFVQPRTRAFGVPGLSSPRQDPLVQRVIGRVSSLVYSAESLVENVARGLEDLYQSAVNGMANEAHYAATEIKAFQAQQIVIEQILAATTLVFEVGGGSATSETRRLDRHWRNARTAASHNPAIARERAIGDYLINGAIPDAVRKEANEKRKLEKIDGDESSKREDVAPTGRVPDACLPNRLS